MWLEMVAVMLVMCAMVFGYLAAVCWRMPSDDPITVALRQKAVDKFPGVAGEMMGRMMGLSAPMTRRVLARPYAITAAALAVLAVTAFLLS